jgi:hypothetical protein
MIESCYWKEELERIARTIRPVQKPVRWSERAHCVVERDLMIGFFIVRRLIELHKVSSKTRDYSMTVFSCPVRVKHVHRMNAHDHWETYDLQNEKRASKKPFYLSNQFIHAYTSFVARDKTRNWSDVYIVSDYDRNECIWRIPVAQIRGLFSMASQDYPYSGRWVYSEEKGDYEVSTN